MFITRSVLWVIHSYRLLSLICFVLMLIIQESHFYEVISHSLENSFCLNEVLLQDLLPTEKPASPSDFVSRISDSCWYSDRKLQTLSSRSALQTLMQNKVMVNILSGPGLIFITSGMSSVDSTQFGTLFLIRVLRIVHTPHSSMYFSAV